MADEVEGSLTAGETEGAEVPSSESLLASLVGGSEFLPKVAAKAAPEVVEESAADEGAGESAEGTEEDGTEGEESDREETGEEEFKGKSREALIGEFQGRIGKVTAKRKEAEERAARLEEEKTRLERELAEAKTGAKAEENPPTAPVSSSDPLADVETPEQLQARVADAQFWQEWAIRNPDGGTVKGANGADIEVTAEQARELQVRATQLLTLHAPKRANWLQHRDMQVAQVQEVYPQLLDRTTADYQDAQALLRAWPELKRFPDFLMVIGDYRAGKAAREAAKQQAKEKGAGTPQPKKKLQVPLAPPVPKASTAPITPAKEITKRKVEDRVVATAGSADAIASYFAAGR